MIARWQLRVSRGFSHNSGVPDATFGRNVYPWAQALSFEALNLWVYNGHNGRSVNATQFEVSKRSDEMGDIIWIVITAGGNK